MAHDHRDSSVRSRTFARRALVQSGWAVPTVAILAFPSVIGAISAHADLFPPAPLSDHADSMPHEDAGVPHGDASTPHYDEEFCYTDSGTIPCHSDVFGPVGHSDSSFPPTHSDYAVHTDTPDAHADASPHADIPPHADAPPFGDAPPFNDAPAHHSSGAHWHGG